MRLVSFDPFRSLGVPGVRTLKAEEVFAHLETVRQADGVLFPASWQVNFLHYGVKRRVFPSIASYHLGHDKVEMTRAFLTVAPEHVPLTRILPATPEGAQRAEEDLGFPMIVKDPRNSMGRGVFLVSSARELAARLPALDVLYAQEYLPCDRDLRVVVVGDAPVAAYWRRGGDGFLHNVARGAEISCDNVPEKAVEMVRRVAAELSIDHAAFDVLVDGDRVLLLELNVLFGNRGLQQLGIDLAPRIYEHLLRTTPGLQPSPPIGRAA